MDLNSPIEITSSGAVRLGADIVCDGFYHGTRARIQTHVHADHLSDFERSKGYQDVITSSPSYDLLVLLKNADLAYRQNFRHLAFDKRLVIGSSSVCLLPSGHILGSAQVEVELDTGLRLGYSGDFQWPLTRVVQC